MRMENRHRIGRQVWLMVAAVLVAILFIFFISSYYNTIMENAGAMSEELNQIYKYQYEMIVDSRNETFWQDVYKNARKEALANSAVLELKSAENGGDYTKMDYMDMSIAAQVDGIILEYNGEKGMQEKIDEAVEKGIPVVIIANDATKSTRQSFVGINDYQLGQVYGEQVAKLIDSSTSRVMLLLNREQELGQNQIYAQIYSAIEKKAGNDQRIKIQTRNILSYSRFDTEEEIRSIFQAPEGPPQILLCLDEVTTKCAYQAMIDYNMVGDVKIIGYYTSRSIMEAVKKGLIPVTISMNVEQIGKYSIEALTEYWEEGRTNAYYNVDLDVISSTKDETMY